MKEARLKRFVCTLSLALAAPAYAAAPPTPLFAGDQPIRITIRAPISSLVSDRTDNPRAGTLALAGTSQALPITLSARGITRRRDEICPFPPLRVDFNGAPPAGSLFARQNRLKLVTHCRTSADFQQKVLLEYAAYRLYNALTPLSFRVRLANVDYVDDNGRPYVSRLGFFLEDIDDVAARNDMVKARTPDRVPLAQIESRAAARFALFNYMIGNLDWSMRAGPQGEGCCHNGRLLAPRNALNAALTPVPYDFDFSGLVDAPYATPPQGFKIGNVRQRVYRGYCAHGAEARAAAAEMSARRGELVATVTSTPGLDARNQRRAASYLNGFFKDLDSGKLFKNCVG
jgi:hypothetical protein